MAKPSHGQVHQQKLQPKLPENCKEKPTNNHGHTGLAEKKKKRGALEEQSATWSPDENHNCTNAPKQPIYNMLTRKQASLPGWIIYIGDLGMYELHRHREPVQN